MGGTSGCDRAKTHITRRRLLSGAAAAAGASVLGGAAPARAAERKVRIGAVKAMLHFPDFVASDLGFFKEVGLEAEFVLSRGGAQINQLLAAGEIEIATGSLEHVMKLKEQNFDARSLVALQGGYWIELVVHRDHRGKVVTVKDLKGKVIGVSGIGSGTHVAARYLVKWAGLDPDKDVSYVAIGGPVTQYAAVKNRQVDAAMIYSPAPEMLKAENLAYTLWQGLADNPPEIFHNWVDSCLNVRKDYLDRNREVCEQVVSAIARAHNAIQAGDPRVVEAAQRMFPDLSPALVKSVLNSGLRTFNPKITPAAVANVSEYLIFAGAVKRPYPYEVVVARDMEPLWQRFTGVAKPPVYR